MRKTGILLQRGTMHLHLTHGLPRVSEICPSFNVEVNDSISLLNVKAEGRSTLGSS